nr:uncharacterized protein LOC110360169 isoform X2 [Columba livia]
MPFCAQAAAREEESQHQLFPGFALCLSSLPALPGRRRGLPGSLWLHSFHLLASKYELQINIIGLALQKNGVMSGDAALRYLRKAGKYYESPGGSIFRIRNQYFSLRGDVRLGHKTELAVKTDPSAEEQAVSGHTAVSLVYLRLFSLGCGIFFIIFFLFTFCSLTPLPRVGLTLDTDVKKLPARMISSLFMIPPACQLSRCVITSVFLYTTMAGAGQIQTENKKGRDTGQTNCLFT